MTLKDALIASKLMGSGGGGGGGGETVEFAVYATDSDGVEVRLEDYATITSNGIVIESTGTIESEGIEYKLFEAEAGSTIMITPEESYYLDDEGRTFIKTHSSKSSFIDGADSLSWFTCITDISMVFNVGNAFTSASVMFIPID